jgi:hypothetical protein
LVLSPSIKSLERKASLQNPYEEHIMIPRQLYEWVVEKTSSVTFEYCTAEDHSKETMMLKERLRKARTLPHTPKIHCVIPAFKKKNKVQTKVVSEAMCSTSIKWKTLEDFQLVIMTESGGLHMCYK